jgi:hypothetical protein
VPSTLPAPAAKSASTGGRSTDQAEVRGQIDPAASDTAAEPPTQDEVLKALGKAHGDANGQHGVTRTKVRMLIERSKDTLDPQMAMPQLGLAQTHHIQFKCTIYYTETAQVDLPTPHKTVDENCKAVIYINRDHLHRVVEQ